jgi:F-type H+-transporting ATPase subunit epsilon
MQVSVISAERSVFDGDAEAVVAPAYDGLVGILPRHAPFMTLLGQGIVTIRQSGGTLTRLLVMGGFLQVASNVVRIVARRAGPTNS